MVSATVSQDGTTKPSDDPAVAVSSTNDVQHVSSAEIRAAESEADQLVKALALGDINWKQELAAKVTLTGFSFKQNCEACCAWISFFGVVGFGLGCWAAGEFGFNSDQIAGLICGFVLGILKLSFSFRACQMFLYLIPAASSAMIYLFPEDINFVHLRVDEVTAVIGVQCATDTGNCTDVTTHYDACENGHCLGFGIVMMCAIVIEQVAAHFLAVKLEAMHANLSQNIHRQGVVWIRTGEDGTETKVNIWQHCKNEEERRNQRLYLAFQSRLRQQGRLANSAIELDPNNEYDVQAFFEQAKIKLQKDYDRLNRLSKALLVMTLTCLATRTTIAIVLCLQEMLEFANCQQALWAGSTDPIRRAVEETWDDTLLELVTVAGSAGPNNDEEGIYCQVDGGAGCTSWYSSAHSRCAPTPHPDAHLEWTSHATTAALGNCAALAPGGALHSNCSTLYGACVNCEQACMSAVIDDIRDAWYLTLIIYLFSDGFESAVQILLQWKCMISSPLCVLVAIPVCFKVGKHIAFVKAKVQYKEEGIVEIDRIELHVQNGDTTYNTSHLGLHGDAIEVANSTGDTSTALRVQQNAKGLSVQAGRIQRRP